MTISEARLYLEHTSIDDFNLEEHQKQNRYEAIQVLLNTIDKAIEYIENHKKPLHHSFDEPDCDYWIATNPDDLLDILRGKENDLK